MKFAGDVCVPYAQLPLRNANLRLQTCFRALDHARSALLPLYFTLAHAMRNAIAERCAGRGSVARASVPVHFPSVPPPLLCSIYLAYTEQYMLDIYRAVYT